MRLFLAIDLPDRVVGGLTPLRDAIRGGRPVPEENLHLTLAFLGHDVPDEAADEVHQALSLRTFACPPLTLGGVGHFGDPAPRAIWVGGEPRAPLAHVHDRMVNVARRAGLFIPRRRYTPHVTLARFSAGDPDAIASLARALSIGRVRSSEAFQPTAFHLFRSHLGRQGPSYDILASYPFTP